MPSRAIKTLPWLPTLLLASACSSRDSALAFARHNNGVRDRCFVPPPPTKSRSAKDGSLDIIDLSSVRYQRFEMSSSLRMRGGGSTTKLSASATSNGSNSNDDGALEQKAHNALTSIRRCVKMCLFSVLSSLLITFVDDSLWSKFWGSQTSLGWIDYADIFDSLSLLFFGGGLWRVSKIYWKSFSNLEERMKQDNLLELFRYMSWIWGVVAANMALVSVTMAATLHSHCGEGPLRFLFDKIESKNLVLGVCGILGMTSAFVLGNCRGTADVEVEAYGKKHDIPPRKHLRNNSELNDAKLQKFDMVREAGYRAYVAQALCAGSFAVVAVMELVKWIVSLSLNAESVLAHVFSIPEFLTTFAITALLVTLNRSLVRAGIAEIIGDEKVNDDDKIFGELFVAQAGFYNKAATVIKEAAIFQLLPYVIAPTVPFVLKALKRMSPALFAKVIEIFGVQM